MAQKNSKHIKEKNKKTSNKSYRKIAFVVLLILLIVMLIKLQNTPKKQNYENTQIILNNENITANLQDSILQENGKIYMSFLDIQKFLDPTIYLEEETGTIITTSDKKIATLKENDENITINGSTQKIKNAFIQRDEKKYIAISELENVYDYDFAYIEENNIVTIDYLSKECIKAYASKSINIKQENKIFSSTIDKVEKGNWLIYIKEENGVAKVRTQNGIIGYVSKKSLNNFVTERDNFEEESKETTPQESLTYDISGEDLSTFEKRMNVINLILQEAIKNDKMSVKITGNDTDNFEFERFKIEAIPTLKECGITVAI